MVWMSCTAIGSTPAKGSSSIMNFGCVTSARVISSRRRSPPESWYGSLCRRCLMLELVEQRLEARAAVRPPRAASVSRIARMFCSTVSLRKIDGSCDR